MEFYRNAQKTDETIKVFEMSEEEFLYLNWRSQPPMSEEEIAKIFEEAERQRDSEKERTREVPEDVILFQQNNRSNRQKKIETEKASKAEIPDPVAWDLSGSIQESLKRYAEYLNADQLDEILKGLEAGLTEKQVKTYFRLPAEKMSQYRRAYMFGKSRR